MRSRGTAFSSVAWKGAPPEAGGGAGEADGADGGAAGAAALGPPETTASRMSFLLIRPPAPLPSMDARSKLFSLASLRTSGELRIFWPSPPAFGAGAAGGTLAAACAGGGGAGAEIAGAAGATGAFDAAAFSGAAAVAAGATAASEPAASITATTV